MAYYYSQQQYPRAPPSPPMEDNNNKCSLPSISNLLDLADSVSDHSPHSSPRTQASPAWRRRELPSHERNQSQSQQKFYPPTPPTVAEASFDHQSPTSHPYETSPHARHFHDRTPPLEDAQRHAYARQGYTSVPPVAPVVAAPTAAHPPPPPPHPVSAQGYQLPPRPEYHPSPLQQQYVPPEQAAWHHHYMQPTQGSAYPPTQDRYICPTCHKAFSRPSSLRIHSHSHTGEKPFKCSQPGCGKAFSVRSNMKRHERGCHAYEAQQGQRPLYPAMN